MEIVKNIGAIIGLILSCITLITVSCKPLRTKIARWVKQTSKTNETNELMEEIRRTLQDHLSLEEQRSQKLEMISESLLDLLRDDINRIYFKYVDRGDHDGPCMKEQGNRYCGLIPLSLGEIPSYEKQNLVILFEQYKKMGGNTYMHNLYEEAMELPISRKK